MDCNEVKVSSCNHERYLNAAREDPLAADLKISIFYTASSSYRYATCCDPHPPNFSLGSTEQYDRLCKALRALPKVVEVKEITDLKVLRKDALDVMHWLFCCNYYPRLKTVPRDKHVSILNLVVSSALSNVGREIMPQYVFEVVDNDALQEQWQELLKSQKSSFAFHGTRVDNVHCILNRGLNPTLCKRFAYGNGLYLSNHLGTCLQYSPFAMSWLQSSIGRQASIVLLVEFLESHSSSPTGVPPTYFLVRESHCIRVKYLLVYAIRAMNPKVQVRRVTEPKDGNRGEVPEHSPNSILDNAGCMKNNSFLLFCLIPLLFILLAVTILYFHHKLS